MKEINAGGLKMAMAKRNTEKEMSALKLGSAESNKQRCGESSAVSASLAAAASVAAGLWQQWYVIICLFSWVLL